MTAQEAREYAILKRKEDIERQEKSINLDLLDIKSDIINTIGDNYSRNFVTYESEFSDIFETVVERLKMLGYNIKMLNQKYTCKVSW
jgi:hypothetical protein